jgi:PAS domain S-box-containing protein
MNTAGTPNGIETWDTFFPHSSKGIRHIVESARNGIVLLERSGKIIIFNKAARRIVDKREDQVIGKSMQEILPESWEDMLAVFQTGQAQIARRIDIGPHSIIANRTPILCNDEVVGILSIFQDIADYEEVVSELETYKQLHEELDVIINSSYDGLWICDSQGKVVRVNRSSEKMSGVKESEVIGRRMEDLVAAGLFDKSATLEVLKDQTAVTLIQELQDGSHILVTGSPVWDNSGNIRLVVVNARDITELNRLHTELAESRALNYQYSAELKKILRDRELNMEVIIRTASMRRVFEMSMRVAPVDSSVLITGESGVGKGLFAELIHKSSKRSNGTLIKVNCGAIPETLIESELFGYEGGAFTGARAGGKPGYLEMAEGGTLLLDEVGELPLGAQVKLLSFLEDNVVIRVGSTRSRKIDVRVIAATNRDLESMINDGSFRKDLFFRLNVVPIKIPPLRERIEDIPPLIHHFLKQFNEKCDAAKSLSPLAVDRLCNYKFPGNIRELSNLIEQLIVLTTGDIIGLEDLPSAVRGDVGSSALISNSEWNLNKTLKGIEKQMILRALKTCGSQRQAAKLLGIDHSTLSRKLKRHQIHNGAIHHRVA